MLQAPDTTTKVRLALADVMEKLDPKLYDQETFSDGCGRGCIAFWGYNTFLVEKEVDSCPDKMRAVAELLGIDNATADKLFSPNAGQVSMLGCVMRGPTPKDAAKALRHLAVTNEVPASWCE